MSIYVKMVVFSDMDFIDVIVIIFEFYFLVIYSNWVVYVKVVVFYMVV